MAEEKFWMCLVVGKDVPIERGVATEKHDTVAKARRQAEALARETGNKVYILESLSCCQAAVVQWVDTEILPF